MVPCTIELITKSSFLVFHFFIISYMMYRVLIVIGIRATHFAICNGNGDVQYMM